MSNLLISEPALQVLPSLAVAIGLNEAIFVQQIHYWLLHSKHERKGRKWIYNTYEQWHEQFPFWSLATIKRIIQNVKQLKIVLVDRMQEHFGAQTNWYSINYEELQKLEKAPKKPSSEPLGRVKMTLSRSGQNDPTIGSNCPSLYTENTYRDIDFTTNSGELKNEPLTDPTVVVGLCEDKKQDQLRELRAGKVNVELDKLTTLGASLKIDSTTIRSLHATYGTQKLTRQLKQLGLAKNVRSPIGWLRDALAKDYAEPECQVSEPRRVVPSVEETFGENLGVPIPKRDEEEKIEGKANTRKLKEQLAPALAKLMASKEHNNYGQPH